MLTDKRFVIWGLSRLSVRVGRALAGRGASVTVVRLPGEDGGLQGLLGPEVTGVEADTDAGGEGLRAVGLDGADCLLALSESDLENLRAAVAARHLAPDVPVVLRAFDPLLADQLEQGLNVRRAYSVSALAAPAFVAAACGDQVLETLRLGEGEVPICRVLVRPKSPLLGLNAAAVKARHGCALLARAARAESQDWEAVVGDAAQRPLAEGESALLGGPRESILRVVTAGAGWHKAGRGGWKGRRKPARPAAPRRSTRLPLIAAALLSVLVASVFVFGRFLHLRWVDAVYFVVTTATTTGYGDISLKDGPDWLKLFGCLVMLSGGALLGIVFSYLAAVATAERLDETMSRRAGRMTGHVVVAGLGNLGYRVARQLSDLGLDVVVLDLAPRPRFADSLRARVPVLAGDASLPDSLERVSAARAVAFLACTSDDLANVQACLHARRLNPQTVSVARVFDDALAERLPRAFAIDHALSASQAAVGAFVGAAADGLALRPLSLGSLSFLAGRYAAPQPVTSDRLAEWRAQGVRVLAFRLPSSPLRPPSALVLPLPASSEMILCGPDAAIRAIVGG